MVASRLPVQVIPKTEHDGDSIGADGPAQRYTHPTGIQPGRPSLWLVPIDSASLTGKSCVGHQVARLSSCGWGRAA
jgi:hypothetical protein